MNNILELCNRPPVGHVGDIPVFSATDRYTDNYVRIASDHVAAMAPGHDNPHISNELWSELEIGTRAVVSRYVKDGDRILDVGVGLGRLLEPLTNLDRYGIDLSPEYLQRCREKNISVALSKIEDMPFLDNTFDCVVTSDVLEHVFDLHRCTAQILRVIKPGGHLIVRVPYREDLAVYLTPGLPYEFVHIRSFDENSVRLHFEKIFSCEVLEVSPVVPYWQGPTRLRMRKPGTWMGLWRWFTSGGLRRLGWDPRALWLLFVMSLYDEDFAVKLLNSLAAHNPRAFKELSPYLLMGIEMNFVVRKPMA